jgi:hypothetical protein
MPKPKNLIIRNGNLRLTNRAAEAVGIRISDFGAFFSIASDLLGTWQARTGKSQRTQDFELAKRWTEELRDQLPRTPMAYSKRNVVIENMKIRTQDVGIRVQGADTVIRNNVIEVDTGTAIWIYGPNAVIENNTIIVHGDYQLLEADAPIRLHHGDGAIIRNNRIIIKGHAHKRAISTFDTGTFTVEKNVLQGMTERDEIVKAFIGKLQGNISGNTFVSS